MSDENRINPGHNQTRKILRLAGPALVLVGGLLVLAGLGSFFLAFGGFGTPKLFFLAFLGMPVLFVGIVLCKFAFLGSVARYFAAETAPVGKDTFNYVAKETQPGVSAMASAMGAGLAEGFAADAPLEGVSACPACNAENDADARFCDACGASMPHAQYCANCGTENDPGARFCDHCGTACQ